MKNPKYNDFIGSYTDVFEDEGFIDYLIAEFEGIRNGDYCGTSNRQDEEGCNKRTKQDDFLFLNLHPSDIHWGEDRTPVSGLIHQALQHCFDHYVSEYDILLDQPLISRCIKMQLTVPGAGYHIWHPEICSMDSSDRVLAWIIYLSDIDKEDGGETEFLYQRKRYSPKKNAALIWPAGFTHTHRGNVNLGNDNKYILTGWFSFRE